MFKKNDKTENKPRKRRVTLAQIRQIKKTIGLRLRDPLPKCPVKAPGKLRKLEAAGDFTHTDTHHAACATCGCNNVAGKDTLHLGYGYCKNHERVFGYFKSRKIMTDHKIALQQRNPAAIHETDDFIDAISEDALIIQEQKKVFDLIPEAMACKNILRSFYTMLSDYEKNEETRERVERSIATIEKNVGSLQSITKEEVKDLSDKLDELRHKLVSPLTERGGKEMSTEVRMKLVGDTLGRMAQAIKILQEIMMVDSITADNFKLWINSIFTMIKTEFGETTYLTKDGYSQKVMDGIGKIFIRAGNPTKGTE